MRPTVTILALGALLIAVLAAFSSGPITARAQDLPPRPPLPTTTPTPTATPAPGESGERSRQSALGRLTGTVIDVSTGAPVANVAVRIGKRIVVSDANGNYDWSGLPAGNYELALALPSDWGIPLQGTLTVEVESGTTMVQHLFFLGR